MTLYQNRSVSRRSHAGFSLIEILVVIGIIAVLLGILLPVISRAREASRKTACAMQVRQLVAALAVYSGEHDLNLPAFKTSTALSQTNWDIPLAARDFLVKYGATRKLFYCPANLEQNRDIFWTYSPEWTVTGYFFYIPRLAWSASWLNASYTTLLPNGQPDLHHDAGQRYFAYLHGQPRPAEYELVSDAVLESGGTFSTFAQAVGSATSHLDGNTPQGANVGYHDGHVAWRRFDEMVKRPGTPSGTPNHYW